jgi:type IV secretory pathway VirB10-like protein
MVGKAEPKPRKGRLKVFRTAIGFHDAYVAAPSRKAALAAWGTDKDLFARGGAEEVSDPALMKEPLSVPGTVFRKLRSMPPDEAEGEPSKPRKRKAAGGAAVENSMRPVPPPPQPSDEDVEKARGELQEAREQHAREEQDLAARERDLARERKAMEQRHAKELGVKEKELVAAQERYDERLAAWKKAVK